MDLFPSSLQSDNLPCWQISTEKAAQLLIGINLWAVLTAALSAFLLGGFWYSPKGFGNIWKREAGIRLPQAAKKGHPPLVYGSSFIFAFIGALALAIFVGPEASTAFVISSGLVVGLCFVAASFSINYLFAGRSLKLLLIDSGYHILQFAAYGVIIGLWR